jgi:hypothetical protein
MKPELRFHRLNSMVLPAIMLLATMVFSATLPTRLNLYDNANNYLMYIDFIYDQTNPTKLLGRTMYMADGTFMRDVVLYTDPASGKRTSEVSTNFNSPNGAWGKGDTSFVMGYTYNANTTSFTLKDQFKLDFLGGPIYYANPVPNETPSAQVVSELFYQLDNSPAAKIVYENDAAGSLSKIYIYDQTGVQQYYGVFASVGVTRRIGSVATTPQARVRIRGGVGVDVQLSMAKPGLVKCELMTLSGRSAGTFFNEVVQKGDFLKSFRTGSRLKAANGVYLFVVSVNGKVVTSSRYLHEAAMGGVQ